LSKQAMTHINDVVLQEFSKKGLRPLHNLPKIVRE
jgi:hypothetical protein